MHEQRPAAVPALSLIMPRPPLPRRRSPMLSSASDPRTPPPRDNPLPLLSPASNRKSSDSWNSSNYDAADDFEWEWKPEQTRLLSRTLDALPAHLLTPFNGPVPPSNLLDKIARGVTQAKGPAEWPHSLRATRAKIVELARLRAKEDTASDTIAEEESTDPDVLQQTTNTRFKRPLYRQSSMDFMQSPKLDPPDNDTIARLSYRLQHTIPNPAYPYVRTSPCLRTTRTLASTASSTTLNSQSSCGSGSRIPRLRRSLSSLSNSSESYIQQPGVDPRVSRIRRAESFAGSALYPPGSPLKCAPSFGVISKRSSDAMSVDHSNRSDVTTSSDEEEKMRSKKAKKPRVKPASPTPPALALSLPPTASASPAKPRQLRRTTKQIAKPSGSSKDRDGAHAHRASKPKANLQRNPSIFGPELPSATATPAVSVNCDCHGQGATPSLRSLRQTRLTVSPQHGASPYQHPSAHRYPTPPAMAGTPVPQLSTPAHRPSRRRKAPAAGAVGRKISFGSLAAPQEENVNANAGLGASGLGLESAFQLQ